MLDRLKIAIVGAGLSGLSAAMRIARSGAQVDVFEAASGIGGMARTYTYGPYKFDLGPHSFYPRRPEMAKLFQDLMLQDDTAITVRGAIYREGKVYRYPWSVVDFATKNSWTTGALYLSDYVRARTLLPLRRAMPAANFEDWCRIRFGRRFYNFFLEGHISKSYGIAPNRLPWIWAAQRIHVPSLRESFGDWLSPRIRLARSHYPSTGIGMLANALAAQAAASDAQIHLGCPVTGILLTPRGVAIKMLRNRTEPEEELYDRVVTTIALPEMISMITPVAPPQVLKASSQVRYRASIFAFFSSFGCESIIDYGLGYFPSASELFIRLYEPRKYSEQCAPPNSSSLCVEFHCDYDDELWNMSDEVLAGRTVDQLARIAGIRKARNLSLLAVKRLQYHYPLPTLSTAAMSTLSEYLSSISPAIVSCGRLGSFKYINMDDAILMGRVAAEVVQDRAAYADIGAVADRTAFIETGRRG